MICRAYKLIEETFTDIIILYYYCFQLLSCSCDKEWPLARVQEDMTNQATLYVLLKRVSGSNVSLEDFGGTRSHERDRCGVCWRWSWKVEGDLTGTHWILLGFVVVTSCKYWPRNQLQVEFLIRSSARYWDKSPALLQYENLTLTFQYKGQTPEYRIWREKQIFLTESHLVKAHLSRTQTALDQKRAARSWACHKGSQWEGVESCKSLLSCLPALPSRRLEFLREWGGFLSCFNLNFKGHLGYYSDNARL